MNTTPAVIVNIQRQPGANIIQVVDRIQKLLPCCKQHPACRGQGDHFDRPHHHHSRLGEGRRI
jgi:hypothetical protein